MAVNARVKRLSEVPEILDMGTVALMKKYHASHITVQEARTLATYRLVEEHGAVALLDKTAATHRSRTFGVLVRAEKRFHGIFREILNSAKMAPVGDKHGISRERVRQLKCNFHEMLELESCTNQQLVDRIEEKSAK